jgi:hypothetical protein
MWVPKSPRPANFCGEPPCPLCFVYVEPKRELSGLEKMAIDLFGKPLAQLSLAERDLLDSLGQRIHTQGLPSSPPPPPSKPLDEELDVGMSTKRKMELWLKTAPIKEPPKEKEPQKTVDQIADELVAAGADVDFGGPPRKTEPINVYTKVPSSWTLQQIKAAGPSEQYDNTIKALESACLTAIEREFIASLRLQRQQNKALSSKQVSWLKAIAQRELQGMRL